MSTSCFCMRTKISNTWRLLGIQLFESRRRLPRNDILLTQNLEFWINLLSTERILLPNSAKIWVIKALSEVLSKTRRLTLAVLCLELNFRECLADTIPPFKLLWIGLTHHHLHHQENRLCCYFVIVLSCPLFIANKAWTQWHSSSLTAKYKRCYYLYSTYIPSLHNQSMPMYKFFVFNLY